ncbi:hypothetical protein EYF80_009844 [Liparis tanakae]|uniref:Uncharacterized protein n=1 Tax=Liparis tanakae TaxID=230148 RepID=A0A4Z2IPT1_9TELE|nr:hypothetical protein EYF80_009844 [Liparis tanakae]
MSSHAHYRQLKAVLRKGSALRRRTSVDVFVSCTSTTVSGHDRVGLAVELLELSYRCTPSFRVDPVPQGGSRPSGGTPSLRVHPVLEGGPRPSGCTPFFRVDPHLRVDPVHQGGPPSLRVHPVSAQCQLGLPTLLKM